MTRSCTAGFNCSVHLQSRLLAVELKFSEQFVNIMPIKSSGGHLPLPHQNWPVEVGKKARLLYMTDRSPTQLGPLLL